MMTFKMDTGGALAAGQGVGNAIKALAMGQHARARAEQEGFADAARVGSSMASARKANADAELAENRLRFAQSPMESAMLELGLPTALAPAFKDRLATGQWGGDYAPPELDGVGPFKPAPADDDTVNRLGQTLSLMQRMLATGSNAEQYSDAALKDQRRRNIDRVMANPSLAGSVGLSNAANEGKPLFNAVGNTGVSLNQFTGDQAQVNDVLAKLFGNESKAKTNKDNAAARKSIAEASLEKAKLSHFNETGALPGTKQSKDESFNVGQIRDDIRADYNAIWSAGSTGFRPQEAPTYEEFSRQWLKQYNIPEAVLYGGGAAQDNTKNRPGEGSAQPPSASQQSKPKAAKPVTPPSNLKNAPMNQGERVVDEVYISPRGAVRWTGFGWAPVAWSGAEWTPLEVGGAQSSGALR